MAIPPPPQGPQPPYGQGPQPPYGWQQPPPAYPYGPAGFPPQPRTNGLAIASMVLGILCFLPPLGLILGIVALSQINKRGERGKGMAVAGITLSSIGTAFVVLAFSLGWAASFWGGFTDAAEESQKNGTTFTLKVGECFNSPTGKLEGETTDIDVVDCDGAHDGEAYGTFRLDDGSYPGETRIAQIAEDKCAPLADSYFGDPDSAPGNIYDYYFYPTQESWSLGDREVTCLIGDENGGKLTGSLRDSLGGGSGSGGTDSGGTGSGGSTGDLEGDPGQGAEV
ncbi:DUF4190 domain-containing protein [Streptomyces monticola]|uniref:DUF4190 domain-containing protein n=1 Tax=Streptomyces monticola TaxID=2666263 RepID=A0ABW2JHM5_9ACTN